MGGCKAPSAATQPLPLPPSPPFAGASTPPEQRPRMRFLIVFTTNKSLAVLRCDPRQGQPDDSYFTIGAGRVGSFRCHKIQITHRISCQPASHHFLKFRASTPYEHARRIGTSTTKFPHAPVPAATLPARQSSWWPGDKTSDLVAQREGCSQSRQSNLETVTSSKSSTYSFNDELERSQKTLFLAAIQPTKF